MRLFFRYLRQRWVWLAACLVFCLIFFASFALYRLPWKAVAYPALLCLLPALAILIWDYRTLRRRHLALQALLGQAAAVMEGFPAPHGIEGEDYQAIIHRLREEQRTLRGSLEGRYGDMVEYYTLWAHQIKTPIAAMRLTLQNEDSPLSRQVMDDLFRVEQYVEMVLTFLRLDAPSTDYVIHAQPLDPIVRQCVKKFAGQFISRRLSLDYQSLDLQVVTDEKWLAFVIEQLLSNALKYTPPGGRVTLRLEAPATLCVEDTGIGIAPEDLPRVFEKGYTGCNGRLDKRASGIGLYLCRRVCQRLGHGLEARPAPAGGTVLAIDLSHYKLEAE